MEENRSREYNRLIRYRLTDRALLKRIGITRKAMQTAFEWADLKGIARQLDAMISERREALLEAMRKSQAAQSTAAEADGRGPVPGLRPGHRRQRLHRG